jgi:hypothetical protein
VDFEFTLAINSGGALTFTFDPQNDAMVRNARRLTSPDLDPAQPIDGQFDQIHVLRVQP